MLKVNFEFSEHQSNVRTFGFYCLLITLETCNHGRNDLRLFDISRVAEQLKAYDL